MHWKKEASSWMSIWQISWISEVNHIAVYLCGTEIVQLFGLHLQYHIDDRARFCHLNIAELFDYHVHNLYLLYNNLNLQKYAINSTRQNLFYPPCCRSPPAPLDGLAENSRPSLFHYFFAHFSLLLRSVSEEAAKNRLYLTENEAVLSSHHFQSFTDIC